MGSSSSKPKNPVLNQATTDPDNPPTYKKLKDKNYPAKFKALAAQFHTDLKPGLYQEGCQVVYDGNLLILMTLNELYNRTKIKPIITLKK